MNTAESIVPQVDVDHDHKPTPELHPAPCAPQGTSAWQHGWRIGWSAGHADATEAAASRVERLRASLQRCRNALARVPGVDLPMPKETPLRNAITLEVPLSLLREAQSALKEEV